MSTVLDLIWEPLSYGFLQRSFLVTAAAALVCALLSCWLVLMGWSLMGDAISHAVLPGVVLAYAAGLPFVVGALCAALAAVSLIGWVRRSGRIREDSAIGIVFTSLFALGLILVSAIPSHLDLNSILFGSVLGVSQQDLTQIVGLAALVVFVLLLKRKDLILYAFDPAYAQASGLRPTLLGALLLVLLAITTVVSLQIVGVVLVVAMLVIPGATARMLTNSFNRMLVLPCLVCLGGSLAGLYVSYYLDISAGGSVVALQGLIFFAVYLLAPGCGVLSSLRRFYRQKAR